jgi:hypothetical protein
MGGCFSGVEKSAAPIIQGIPKEQHQAKEKELAAKVAELAEAQRLIAKLKAAPPDAAAPAVDAAPAPPAEEGAEAEEKLLEKDRVIDELRNALQAVHTIGETVEVFSVSEGEWCRGYVVEVTREGVNAMYSCKSGEERSKFITWADENIRYLGKQEMKFAAHGHETLAVNSPVEVYSNSLGVWCPGIVQEVNDGNFVICFFYPDMDPNTEQPAQKELPFGHQDLRLPGLSAGAPYNAGPPVKEEDLVAGGTIEVFSQSRQVWIDATVKEVVDGMVTVQLRYPDMPPDSDLYEKVLPVGHGDMRLPQPTSPSGAGESADATTS